MTALGSLSVGWVGLTYRHIPSDNFLQATNTQSSTTRGGGRWNSADEQVLYLAGDQGVAVAEFARHVSPRPLAVNRPIRRRYIFEIHARLSSVLDLRDTQVCRVLEIDEDPLWIRDMTATQRVATGIREQSDVQAIIVPSIAFLDDVQRWNMVVFADTLPTWPAPFVVPHRIVGEIDAETLFGMRPGNQQRG